jgi:hypothetical protein
LAASRFQNKFWQVCCLQTRADGNVGPALLLGQWPIAPLLQLVGQLILRLEDTLREDFSSGVSPQTSSLSFLQTMTCFMGSSLST